ncbi:MAG: sugar phosphate nucleotidyltransferase [Armatimonadetes bacterium]|nr:sugar phosphate nucleotidyltransferase [Armatimonadota bacterium]MDW8121231.1 sugar phosphate nucleotidyltransferase [Armatimonadota bacterium]
MKGVVLAGGLGTRLYPLTKVTNKHLLPIYNKPMIWYPLEALVIAGVVDILVITGGEWATDFARLLGDFKEMGIRTLYFAYQEKPLGIAHALSLAETFANGDRIVVFLADNVIEGNIIGAKEKFEKMDSGALVILKEVPDPHNYGCPAFDQTGRIVSIIEKPQQPPSPYAVIGIYFYDHQVFDFCRRLKPSPRGELEISDVNNLYAQMGALDYLFLDGWWGDAGASIDAWLRVNRLVAETGANKRALK